MTHNKYAFGKFNKELMARAMARDANVSAKVAVEMCNYLRNRKLQQAKVLLQEVLAKKRAIPFKRFTDGVGHRKGKLASGRFPQKGSTVMLKLIESAETNAQLKGLNTGELSIIHLCAHKAHSPVHYGRSPGREFKRTHIEVVVQETPTKGKKGKAGPKKEKKDEVKTETPKKAEPKQEEPVKAQPKKEEPKPAEPKKEEPKPAEPKKEEPKPAEPKQVEKKEEVKTEEPVKEEPKEDKKEDQGAQ